jgi:hypothetical protein
MDLARHASAANTSRGAAAGISGIARLLGARGRGRGPAGAGARAFRAGRGRSRSGIRTVGNPRRGDAPSGAPIQSRRVAAGPRAPARELTPSSAHATARAAGAGGKAGGAGGAAGAAAGGLAGLLGPERLAALVPRLYRQQYDPSVK